MNNFGFQILDFGLVSVPSHLSPCRHETSHKTMLAREAVGCAAAASLHQQCAIGFVSGGAAHCPVLHLYPHTAQPIGEHGQGGCAVVGGNQIQAKEVSGLRRPIIHQQRLRQTNDVVVIGGGNR